MGKTNDKALLAYQLKDILEMHFSEDETQVQSTVGRIMRLVQMSKPCDEVKHFFGFGLRNAGVLIHDGVPAMLNQVLVLDRNKQSVEIFEKRE